MFSALISIFQKLIYRHRHRLTTGGHVVSAFVFAGEHAGFSSRVIIIERSWYLLYGSQHVSERLPSDNIIFSLVCGFRHPAQWSPILFPYSSRFQRCEVSSAVLRIPVGSCTRVLPSRAIRRQGSLPWGSRIVRRHFDRKICLPRANRILDIRYLGIHCNFDKTHVVLFPNEKDHMERTHRALLEGSGEGFHHAHRLTNRSAVLPVSHDSHQQKWVFVCGLNAEETLCISCTVGINLGCVVCLLSPSVSASYRAFAVALNLTIQNAMACRVFRLLGNVHLPRGIGFDTDTNTIYISSRYSTLEFAQPTSGMT